MKGDTLLLALLLGCLLHGGAATAADDASALSALKSSLSGGASLTSWATGSSPCADNWHGVTCSGGRVVSLELGGLGLKGTLPAELAQADQLQLLSLGGNSFTGSLPAEWGEAGAFPLLVSLDVNGSALSGALSEVWGASSVLPTLQTLVLDGNRLSGSLPQSWGAAGSFGVLTTLSVKGNALSGTLPPTWCNDAASLPGLQALQLDGNAITGSLPDFWGATGCQEMRTLTLSSNQLTGSLPGNWGSKGYWPALQEMRLQDNGLSSDFPAEWTAPTAFPAMRTAGTGIVLQPGNAKLTGAVPSYTKFPVLTANGTDGATAAIDSLVDTAPAPAPAPAPDPALAPAPAYAPAPVPAPSPALQQPWTLQAGARLTGQGLWPFTALQRAAFKGALVAALNSAPADIAEPQITVATAKIVSGSVAQYADVKPGRRLLQQSTQVIQVPVFVQTTAGAAEADRASLTAAITSAAFREQLLSAGFDLSSVGLGTVSSTAGDSVPAAGPASEAGAAAPATSSRSGSGASNTGAIIGGVIGGLAALALLGLAVWLCVQRRRKQAQYITQRIVMPRQAPFGTVSMDQGMPYRKTGLATVQELNEGYSPKGSPAAYAVSQHSSTGSPRAGGRLTQGLYRSSSTGRSLDFELLDGHGVRSTSFNEVHASSPCAAPVTAGGSSPGGGNAPLTQDAVAQHTQSIEREDAASWSSRFSRTFSG